MVDTCFVEELASAAPAPGGGGASAYVGALAAALASMDAYDELDERVKALVAERARVVAALRAQGWEFPEPYANFFWLPIGERTDEAAEHFVKAALSVRVFSGEGIRISIGEREANDRVISVCADLKRLGF